MHATTTLPLCHVACRIRSAQRVFDATTFLADLHQPDADAYIENLVAPDKTIILDRIHNVVSNLRSLLQGTA